MRKSGRGVVVFYDNLTVKDPVIVERKVVEALSDGHAPLLLINFGRPKVEIRPATLSFACSRPSLIARTIPFIPADPLHPPQKKRSCQRTPTLRRHPGPDAPEPYGKNDHSAGRANLDDPSIHIHPTIPAISRHSGSFSRNGFFAESIKSPAISA
jgi:hypothetical protein